MSAHHHTIDLAAVSQRLPLCRLALSSECEWLRTPGGQEWDELAIFLDREGHEVYPDQYRTDDLGRIWRGDDCDVCRDQVRQEEEALREWMARRREERDHGDMVEAGRVLADPDARFDAADRRD